MAKKVNITEKLELDGNPSLIIGKEELEVNADAATMLKIMGNIQNLPRKMLQQKTFWIYTI